MRLFIAAELPGEMLEALSETSAALRGCLRGRYVAPDSFHVTLAFLGDVAGHRVRDAEEALADACAGAAPIAVQLGQLGSFGRRSKATLWQAVEDDAAHSAKDDPASRAGGRTDLATLAESVRRELAAREFSFDDKKFLAHVTLMRAADLQGGMLPSPALASGTIERVTLFQSDLSGPRPIYTPLRTQTLA